MSKKKFFNIKTFISFIVFTIILSISAVVIAGPDLEKDIKEDLSKYINHLNKGEISEYYNMYNTRKLNEIEKVSFYEKIKNATKIMNEEQETFKKFKLKVKINNVKILKKINNNLYLCNLIVSYQIREGIDTTKTIKKNEEFIVKVLNVGKDGYKILLPFNAIDKDFSESETFLYLEQLYKDKKAKEIEEKRLLEEEKESEENENNSEDEEYVDEDRSEPTTEDAILNLKEGSSIIKKEDNSENKENRDNEEARNNSNENLDNAINHE